MHEQTAVVVLAAGAGTRMRSKTPKVLHPLAGRSMLAHSIYAAQGIEPDHLVTVVGHDREQVGAAVADPTSPARTGPTAAPPSSTPTITMVWPSRCVRTCRTFACVRQP